jgi:PAS domain S-box-containing protein
MEGIPQLVWRSGDEGRWTWSSPQWQSFTGQSLAESLGLGWLDAVHSEDRDATMRAWEAAKPHGMLDIEYRVHRASDGAYLWHHTRSVPVRDEGGRIVEWLGTTTDVQQLKEFQERQEVMVAELQHRTRNLIAVVRSIAQQTMAQTGPTEAFRDEFNHRLEALARVQGLLSRSDEEPITIEALIRMELDALGAKAEPGRIEVDGPPVRIRPTVVQTLALALHELATNARKYGALSNSDGRLAITWRTYEDGNKERLALDWAESGGQPPKPNGDPRRGYGRELIERALPYSLNARTSFEHDEAGLRCTIVMPLERTRSRRRVA